MEKLVLFLTAANTEAVFFHMNHILTSIKDKDTFALSGAIAQLKGRFQANLRFDRGPH